MYDLRASLAPEVISNAFDSEWLNTRRVIAARGHSPFRWLSSEYRLAVATLRGVCSSTVLKAHSARLNLLDRLIEVRRLTEEIRTGGASTSLFGQLWRDGYTDWSKLEDILVWMETAHAFQPEVDVRTAAAFELCDHSGPWPPSPDERLKLISILAEARELHGQLIERRHQQTLLGPLWKGDDTDWPLIRRLLSWVAASRRFEPALQLRSRAVLSGSDRAAGLASDMRHALAEAQQAFTAMRAGFALNETVLPGVSIEKLSADDFEGLAALWKSSFHRITEWPPIREDLRWSISIGCAAVAERAFDGRIEAIHLENTFLVAAYEAMWL